MIRKVPRYSVVDIETTGGKAGQGRITEIAIFIMEGEKIVDEFISLVNPESRIPPYISRLTGITNKMVEDAPKFYEIARRIVEITEDTIFVAHNASFDYNFIKKEFESLGYDYVREVICTVALSRKVIPGHSSYSLGQLCNELNIPLSNRHRAGGDAHATALLLKHLIAKNGDFIYPKEDFDIKGLNPALDLKKLRALPEEPGVYYFHNSEKRVIYIGKSRNIKKRIYSHLSARNKRALRLKENLTDVSYELTGSELVALLREADEIKQQRPLFNKAGRHSRFNWGIYHFVDQRGYERFFIDRIKQSISQPLDAFSTREKAIQTLSSWVEEYNLCRQLAGLEDNKGPCFSYQVHQCNGACIGNEKPADYNARVSKMLKKLSFSSSNFIVFDKGRHSGEKSFVWVEKNVLRGYGWLNQEDTITHPAQLEEYISGGTDNRDTRKIVRTWLNNKSTSQIRILKY